MHTRIFCLIFVFGICRGTSSATPIVLVRTPYGAVLATDSLQTNPNKTVCKPMFTKKFALVEATNMVSMRIRKKLGKIALDADPRTAYIQSLMDAKDIADAKKRIIRVAESYFENVLSYFVRGNAPEQIIAEQRLLHMVVSCSHRR